jgi:hypothetical protein
MMTCFTSLVCKLGQFPGCIAPSLVVEIEGWHRFTNIHLLCSIGFCPTGMDLVTNNMEQVSVVHDVDPRLDHLEEVRVQELSSFFIHGFLDLASSNKANIPASIEQTYDQSYRCWGR